MLKHAVRRCWGWVSAAACTMADCVVNVVLDLNAVVCCSEAGCAARFGVRPAAGEVCTARAAAGANCKDAAVRLKRPGCKGRCCEVTIDRLASAAMWCLISALPRDTACATRYNAQPERHQWAAPGETCCSFGACSGNLLSLGLRWGLLPGLCTACVAAHGTTWRWGSMCGAACGRHCLRTCARGVRSLSGLPPTCVPVRGAA
jgi:hypothetical protein